MEEDLCCICNRTGDKKNINIIHTIYQCPSCGLLWLAFNNLDNTEKAQYVKSFENINELRIGNYNTILDYVYKLLPKNAKGLEVGSACGTFLIEAQKRGYMMSGIEPMEESFKIAKEQDLDVYKGFFPQDLSGQNNFDFIIFNDVFEHIPESQNVVMACHNLLNDDGMLIINLPISDGILYRISNILDKLKMSDYLERMWQVKTESPHLYYFNKKNLVNLMKNNGFIYVNEVKMKTLKVKGLSDRISAIRFNKIKAKIIAFLLILSIPILSLLPKDTSCFIFRKS